MDLWNIRSWAETKMFVLPQGTRDGLSGCRRGGMLRLRALVDVGGITKDQALLVSEGVLRLLLVAQSSPP